MVAYSLETMELGLGGDFSWAAIELCTLRLDMASSIP